MPIRYFIFRKNRKIMRNDVVHAVVLPGIRVLHDRLNKLLVIIIFTF